MLIADDSSPQTLEGLTTDQNRTEPESCPPGHDGWVRVHLPTVRPVLTDDDARAIRSHSLVAAANRGAGRVDVLAQGLRTEEVLRRIPGARLERYWRSTNDPYRCCEYANTGGCCKHNPSCGD